MFSSLDARCIRWIAAVALAALVAVGPVGIGAAGAAGGDPDAEATSTTLGEIPDAPGIIPEPNSGRAPEDAGDRGGALQVALLGVTMTGVGVIAALAVRESRKKRQT